ncbi:Fatty acyl-CoA reductase 3 [Citrus sinensis]|nr:Fatty acyl-CoA reductase 3 [Citrus sinensis]
MQIPADMVVNAMIVAMVAHAKQSSYVNIYRVGSSLRNPVTSMNILDYSFDYFTKKSWIDNIGKPVKVTKVIIFSRMVGFHGYMKIQYLLPLKLSGFTCRDHNWQNTLCCQYFEGMLTGRRRKTNFVMPLVEIYGPHLLSNAIFADRNTEKLRMATRENMMETDIFSFILSALIGKITS